MAYGHSVLQTQYTHTFVKQCFRLNWGNKPKQVLFFVPSVRLGTATAIFASRVRFTYSVGWLQTTDTLHIQ